MIGAHQENLKILFYTFLHFFLKKYFQVFLMQGRYLKCSVAVLIVEYIESTLKQHVQTQLHNGNWHGQLADPEAVAAPLVLTHVLTRCADLLVRGSDPVLNGSARFGPPPPPHPQGAPV